MVKSLNAFRIVFNTLLSVVELLIGMRFLVGFGSNDSVTELVATVKETLDQMGFFASGIFVGTELEKAISALLLMLGFMLFSFVLITIAPAMVARKERELELAEDDYD